jgi:hypothetical protein
MRSVALLRRLGNARWTPRGEPAPVAIGHPLSIRTLAILQRSGPPRPERKQKRQQKKQQKPVAVAEPHDEADGFPRQQWADSPGLGEVLIEDAVVEGMSGSSQTRQGGGEEGDSPEGDDGEERLFDDVDLRDTSQSWRAHWERLQRSTTPEKWADMQQQADDRVEQMRSQAKESRAKNQGKGKSGPELDPQTATAVIESVLDHMAAQHRETKKEYEEIQRSPWRRRFEREVAEMQTRIGRRYHFSNRPITADYAKDQRDEIAAGMQKLRDIHATEFRLAVEVTGANHIDLFHGDVSTEVRAHMDLLEREGKIGRLDWSKADAFREEQAKQQETGRDARELAFPEPSRIPLDPNLPFTDAELDELRDILGAGNDMMEQFKKVERAVNTASADGDSAREPLPSDDMLRIAYRAMVNLQSKQGGQDK